MEGFTHGFNLGNCGPTRCRDTAKNLPFQVGVGNKEELYAKIMKEVKAKRYASPYDEIPFRYYIQSPIGWYQGW